MTKRLATMCLSTRLSNEPSPFTPKKKKTFIEIASASMGTPTPDSKAITIDLRTPSLASDSGGDNDNDPAIQTPDRVRLSHSFSPSSSPSPSPVRRKKVGHKIKAIPKLRKPQRPSWVFRTPTPISISSASDDDETLGQTGQSPIAIEDADDESEGFVEDREAGDEENSLPSINSDSVMEVDELIETENELENGHQESLKVDQTEVAGPQFLNTVNHPLENLEAEIEIEKDLCHLATSPSIVSRQLATPAKDSFQRFITFAEDDKDGKSQSPPKELQPSALPHHVGNSSPAELPHQMKVDPILNIISASSIASAASAPSFINPYKVIRSLGRFLLSLCPEEDISETKTDGNVQGSEMDIRAVDKLARALEASSSRENLDVKGVQS